jgi:hypothetical protein
MRPGSDIHKELNEALRDIEPTALGMVARKGTIAPAGLGPAELAALEIKSELAYACRLIKVAVQGSWVTLEGEVEWNYQKNGAETAVRAMPWVKGISNDLHIQPRIEGGEVGRRIEAELRSHPERGSDAGLRSWVTRI